MTQAEDERNFLYRKILSLEKALKQLNGTVLFDGSEEDIQSLRRSVINRWSCVGCHEKFAYEWQKKLHEDICNSVPRLQRRRVKPYSTTLRRPLFTSPAATSSENPSYRPSSPGEAFSPPLSSFLPVDPSIFGDSSPLDLSTIEDPLEDPPLNPTNDNDNDVMIIDIMNID